MTIFYPDASEYEATLPAAPAGAARACIGAVKDAKYDQFRALAAQRGQRFMAYAFLNHDALTLTAGSGGPSIPAEQQADFAFSVVGSSVPLMLDWEANRGLSADVGMAWRFINRYRSHGGILNTFYLPRWYWSNIGQPDLRPFAAAGLHLVSSNYPSAGYTDNGPGWAGYGGIDPDVWQFTDNWQGTGADGNAYRGTVDQWWEMVLGVKAAATSSIQEVTTMLLRFPADGFCVVTDGLGNWRGIPDPDALGVLLKATGLPLVDITDAEALKLGIDRAHPPAPPAPVTNVTVSQDELNAAVAAAVTVPELTAALAALSVKITLG